MIHSSACLERGKAVAGTGQRKVATLVEGREYLCVTSYYFNQFLVITLGGIYILCGFVVVRGI
jgi:hypothetical protein